MTADSYIEDQDTPFSSLALYFATCEGMPRYGYAFLMGALMTLAMPPLSFFPVLLIALPILYWLTIGSVSKRQAFATGWAFGAGYFIFGLYWISFALLVDLKSWWWVMPLAVVILPCLFAIYTGLATLATRILRLYGLAGILAFAALLTGSEYLRGTLFTGFPWNLAGYTWVPLEAPLQIAALTGIYGLTLLTVLIGLLPAVAVAEDRPAIRQSAALAIIFLFVAGCVFGALRLQAAPNTSHDAIKIRIVQPNIEQSAKWDAQSQSDHFFRQIAQSRADGFADITHIVWPETALTADLTLNPDVMEVLAERLSGKILLTGNLRVSRDESGQDLYHNSLISVDAAGRKISSASDKFHLVPFGEYVPFRDIIKIPSLAEKISKVADFARGKGPSTVEITGTPYFSPLVCYEVIFPGAVTDPQKRPDWLLNVTNDAWYGRTAGPHQHLAIARVRAVEEGLPLVRAANTGISAIVSPTGKVIKSLALGTEGYIDATLPKPLPPTVYSRTGNTIFAGMMALVALAALLAARFGKKRA